MLISEKLSSIDENKQKHELFTRSIKSYANRDSSLTNSQKCAIEKYWSKYGVNIEKSCCSSHNLIEFEKYFSNDNPFVLEIGFGNGKSLITMAKNQPNVNFIGIEVYKKGIGAILSDIVTNNLNNIRIIWHDAVEVLEKNIPDNFFSKVQLFFPDPWPKKRHHKRRIIQKEFVQVVGTKMKKDGILHLATDWEHYAYHMMNVLIENKDFKNMKGEKIFSNCILNRPKTKFETKGIALGHKVWDLVFKKV